MDFNSIDEAINFIQNAVSSSLPEMGEEMRLIMNESIQKEIYNDHGNNTGTRTGQLGNCADVVEMDNNSITTEYMDKGSWNSAITGEKFFPLEGFLAGSVWAPGGGYYQSDPTTEAFFECNEKIPEQLKARLMSMGIPIE